VGFPPKEFYTVDVLSSRWDTPPLKIIEWAMSRKIELVIALPEAELCKNHGCGRDDVVG
jgi:hypothetical protein